MRICLVAAEYSWPDYAGGIKTYTQILAKGLVRSGHVVHIITTDVGGVERHYEEDNVLVHCVGPRRILPRGRERNTTAPTQAPEVRSRVNELFGGIHLFRRSLRVRNEVLRLANSSGVDIVSVPDWNAEGLWLTLRPFVPVVVTLHGPRFWARKIKNLPVNTGSWLAEYLEKHAILRATAIVSPSSAMRSMVAQEYRMASLENKIIVIPNPVDPVLFRPEAVEDNQAQDQTLTVTYVGRLEFRKGVHVLAGAIPMIKNEWPEVRFRFIGADTPTAPGGGSMQAFIHSQTQHYRDTIDFTGPLPRHTLPGYYSGSAIVVLPSLEENLAYTCAEAMACGACVVASNVGGFGDMIDDRETGYLVPPGDAKALAQVIMRLLAEPDERRRVGASARTSVLERMSVERITEQSTALYERMLHDR